MLCFFESLANYAKVSVCHADHVSFEGLYERCFMVCPFTGMAYWLTQSYPRIITNRLKPPVTGALLMVDVADVLDEKYLPGVL